MNHRVSGILKNVSFSVSSNLISLLVSTLVILVIPKLIGVEEYGYWQLYLFYSAYVGFLHFGWNDGIYLRYGGEDYESLDKKLLFSQFVMLLISQLIIGSLIWFVAGLFIDNADRIFIIKMVAIAAVLENMKYMFVFILQATNRIKHYAQITILDRIMYILIITALLLVGVRAYKLMIFADLFAKLISLSFAMYLCRDFVFRKITDFRLSLNETFINISVGIKLMFSNIASILLIGIVRFGIERTWDVATFGKISLTLSISNMAMIFINAVGIILFPVLRRTKQEKLADIYSTIRDFIMVLLLGFLVVYYPLKSVMVEWLPQYADSLKYMALVFPMFIFEGKMALLINTYLKTLRREKVMLKINLASMLLSLLMTYFTTQIWMQLDLAIVNIVLLLIVRSALAEIYLAKELNIRVKKDIILEILLTVTFILSGWFVDSWVALLIYFISYALYLIVKKNDIKESVVKIKLLITN